jgi:hypothetical protein
MERTNWEKRLDRLCERSFPIFRFISDQGTVRIIENQIDGKTIVVKLEIIPDCSGCGVPYGEVHKFDCKHVRLNKNAQA